MSTHIRGYWLLILLLWISSCKKKDDSGQVQGPQSVTTVVDGKILFKYNHKPPPAGYAIYMVGWKHKSAFDSTHFDIASTSTDSSGYYHIEGVTKEPITSVAIWAGGPDTTIAPGIIVHELNFYANQPVYIKEQFHIINNYNVPLWMGASRAYVGWIYSADTSFTVTGWVDDTGVNVINDYSYTENGVLKRKSDEFHVGSADTSFYKFVVDASTF